MNKKINEQISVLSKKHEQLLIRLPKLWLIALAVAFFIFGLLSYFSIQRILQTHWFNFLLFSISLGFWTMFLTKFLCWLIFLCICKKNKTKNNMGLINNSLKKSRLVLIQFSFSTGVLLFILFWFLSQQPNEDGTFPSVDFGDILGVFAFSFFIAFCTFMLTATVLSQFLSITLFKKRSPHNSLSTVNDFEENNFSFNPSEKPQFYSAEKNWENWDHDPMNPASAEYQSTYRDWNHND